jgi:hypothetical protein
VLEPFPTLDFTGVDLEQKKTDTRNELQRRRTMAAKKATKHLKKGKRIEATKPLVQKVRD